MGSDTNIEWTDATWNPIRGCTRVSEGCRNCYAEIVAHRFSGPGQAYEGLVRIDAKGERRPQWNGEVRFVEEHLTDPVKWKKPRRIFVNSMSDLFHPRVPDDWINRIFGVMAVCQEHTFQILTKRPERMLEFVSKLPGPNPKTAEDEVSSPLPNVWLGVSCEDQETADARIPLLLQTPAAVRFISAEPLLGAIDLGSLPNSQGLAEGQKWIDALRGSAWEADDFYYDHCGIPKLDWVIAGGESGPHARPMREEWALSLRDQCVIADVPFFFKQWGEWLPPMCDGNPEAGDIPLNCSDAPVRVGKHRAGRILDRQVWNQFPRAAAR